MVIYRRLGGVSPPLKAPPPNWEIVSFRACVRRAASGSEEESKVKNEAGALSLFPFWPREAFPFPFWPRESFPFPFWPRKSFPFPL